LLFLIRGARPPVGAPAPRKEEHAAVMA
jgi:hypothetical protein